jgi:16S rRNA G966 N2-methylase RsmD
VEHDPRAVRLIETNLGRCGVTERYVIIRARFADAARRWTGEKFDLVLLDPPYGRADLLGALDAAAPLIGPGGLLVIEHARRDQAPAHAASMIKTRDIVSGHSALSFYRAAAAGEESAGAP